MSMMFGGSQTTRETSDLAFTDPLTGLGNMRRFFDKVDRLIAERADDPAPFTIGILDLDGFKPINDLFGHKAGDDILDPGGDATARGNGRPVGRDARRRRRIRLPVPDGVQRRSGQRKGQDADRDPVGALRCRRPHGAAVRIGRLLAFLFRRRDHRDPGQQGRDGALSGQAHRPWPRRRLYARDGRGGQARHPHRAGAAPRRFGGRGGAAFPADRRSRATAR